MAAPTQLTHSGPEERRRNPHGSYTVLVGVPVGDTVFVCTMPLYTLVYISNTPWLCALLIQQVCIPPLSDLCVLLGEGSYSLFAPHNWASAGVSLGKSLFLISLNNVCSVRVEVCTRAGYNGLGIPDNIVPRMHLCCCCCNPVNITFIAKINKKAPSETMNRSSYRERQCQQLVDCTISCPRADMFYKYALDCNEELYECTEPPLGAHLLRFPVHISVPTETGMRIVYHRSAQLQCQECIHMTIDYQNAMFSKYPRLHCADGQHISFGVPIDPLYGLIDIPCESKEEQKHVDAVDNTDRRIQLSYSMLLKQNAKFNNMFQTCLRQLEKTVRTKQKRLVHVNSSKKAPDSLPISTEQQGHDADKKKKKKKKKKKNKKDKKQQESTTEECTSCVEQHGDEAVQQQTLPVQQQASVEKQDEPANNSKPPRYNIRCVQHQESYTEKVKVEHTQNRDVHGSPRLQNNKNNKNNKNKNKNKNKNNMAKRTRTPVQLRDEAQRLHRVCRQQQADVKKQEASTAAEAERVRLHIYRQKLANQPKPPMFEQESHAVVQHNEYLGSRRDILTQLQVKQQELTCHQERLLSEQQPHSTTQQHELVNLNQDALIPLRVQQQELAQSQERLLSEHRLNAAVQQEELLYAAVQQEELLLRSHHGAPIHCPSISTSVKTVDQIGSNMNHNQQQQQQVAATNNTTRMRSLCVNATPWLPSNNHTVAPAHQAVQQNFQQNVQLAAHGSSRNQGPSRNVAYVGTAYGNPALAYSAVQQNIQPAAHGSSRNQGPYRNAAYVETAHGDQAPAYPPMGIPGNFGGVHYREPRYSPGVVYHHHYHYHV
jgi:hypothetical protein